MSQFVDVIVVGGGIVGLSAAVAMKQRGFSVGVLDAGVFNVDLSKPDLRVYALNQASRKLLESIAVWPKLLAERVPPYNKMQVWDAVSGGQIEFDARLVNTDRLGTIVEESVVKQALLQQAEDLGILLFPECSVTDIQSTPVEMRIHSHQHQWVAQLVIVADGPKSTTLKRLNVPVTTWPYHQDAIIARVDTEQAHKKTAYQVFHTEGPLAFLPLVDAHQCSVVWSTSIAHAKRLMNLSDDLFCQELSAAFSKKLGEVRAVSERRQFPLSMRHAQRYSGARWILMGDCAHTIHPLAGLGLNVGFADLASWLLLVDANQSCIGSKKMMGAYQRQRKHDVWQQIALMEGLKRLFANPLPPIAFMRGLGLNACDRLSPIKRFFIEHAAG